MRNSCTQEFNILQFTWALFKCLFYAFGSGFGGRLGLRLVLVLGFGWVWARLGLALVEVGY